MGEAIFGILGAIAISYPIYYFTTGPLDSLDSFDRFKFRQHPGQIEQHEQMLKDNRFRNTASLFCYYIHYLSRRVAYRGIIKECFNQDRSQNSSLDDSEYDGWLDERDLPR